MSRASEEELLRWAEALAGVARTGLGFTSSRFEAERYEEILAIAADMLVAAADGVEPADGPYDPADRAAAAKTEWLRSVGSGIAGYVTPKVAVGAVVGDDRGRLLLIKRADSGRWLYPTGWADVGYSASEVAVKEVFEETGVRCDVLRPLAIIDGLRAGFSRVPLYSIVFLCRSAGGAVSPHPQECLDAGWFGPDELPEPLASADRWSDHAFRAINGEKVELMFDPPRHSVWRA